MAIRAVGCTIILKEVKIQEKTKGGILLTTADDNLKTKTYEVVSVGPEVKSKFSDVVEVGDIVMVDKFQGNRISLSASENYVSVVPSQLLCKIEGAEIDD